MPDERNDRGKPSLDRLLRLKRHERPDDAFWSRFDADLHQRMLQTLVKKEPWHAQILRGLSGRLAVTSAAVGAAALFAVLAVHSVAPGTGADRKEASRQAAAAPSAPEVRFESDLGRTFAATENEADAPRSVVRDFKLDAVREAAGGESGESAVTRDFSGHVFQIASYDRSAYSADRAGGREPSANLVY